MLNFKLGNAIIAQSISEVDVAKLEIGDQIYLISNDNHEIQINEDEYDENDELIKEGTYKKLTNINSMVFNSSKFDCLYDFSECNVSVDYFYDNECELTSKINKNLYLKINNKMLKLKSNNLRKYEMIEDIENIHGQIFNDYNKKIKNNVINKKIDTNIYHKTLYCSCPIDYSTCIVMVFKVIINKNNCGIVTYIEKYENTFILNKFESKEYYQIETSFKDIMSNYDENELCLYSFKRILSLFSKSFEGLCKDEKNMEDYSLFLDQKNIFDPIYESGDGNIKGYYNPIDKSSFIIDSNGNIYNMYSFYREKLDDKMLELKNHYNITYGLCSFYINRGGIGINPTSPISYNDINVIYEDSEGMIIEQNTIKIGYNNIAKGKSEYIEKAVYFKINNYIVSVPKSIMEQEIKDLYNRKNMYDKIKLACNV